MTLLALDIATRTGVALADSSFGVPSMRLSSWQLPKSRPLQEKIEAFSDYLVRLTSKEKIEYAAIEIPQSGVGSRTVTIETALGFEKQTKLAGSITTQIQLWGLHGAAVAILYSLRIPYRGIGVREWRKHILGNGNIPGKEAKKACKALCERFEIHCPNEDAAEAAGMLLYLNNNMRRWLAEDALERGI